MNLALAEYTNSLFWQSDNFPNVDDHASWRTGGAFLENLK